MAKDEGIPHPPVFLSQSSQLLEKKRVVFLMDQKKCKKMQKSVQGYEKKGNRESEMEDRSSEDFPPSALTLVPPICMNSKRRHLQKLNFVIE